MNQRLLGVSFAFTLVACGHSQSKNTQGNTPPDAPTNLKGVAQSRQVALTWSEVASATQYDLLRGKASGGPYTQIADLSYANDTDNGVLPGQTYYYVVTATGASGTSGNSKELSVETLADAPSSPQVSVSFEQSVLTWAAAEGASGYVVLRSDFSSGPFAQIATTTATTYTDSGLSAGATYYYEIAAQDSAGSSEPSGVASAVMVPAAPASLAITPADSEVRVGWSATSGATSYVLSRSTSASGPFTPIDTAASTSYDDQGLANGTTYYYEVSATNASGAGPQSAPVTALPLTTYPPFAPTNLAAAGGDKQVTLTWTASYAATGGYAVFRSSVSGAYTPADKVATTGPTSTGYTDIVPLDSTTYYYGSSPDRVGTFCVISDLRQHTAENLELEILLVA